MLLATTAFGQPPKGGQTDSLKLSVKAIRNMLIAAEQKKVCEQQVGILTQKISVYEQIIKNLNEKDSVTVQEYELELKTMQDEKAVYQDQVATFEKMIRKQKRKTFWATVGGTLTTAAALFLFIQK